MVDPWKRKVGNDLLIFTSLAWVAFSDKIDFLCALYRGLSFRGNDIASLGSY